MTAIKDTIFEHDGMLLVHHYDQETHEFIFSGEIHMVPGLGVAADCTTIAPPECGEGFIQIYDNEADVWSIEEDHRGLIVWIKATGEKCFIDKIGPIPADSTTIDPNGDHMRWTGEGWEKDDEAANQAQADADHFYKRDLMAYANEQIAIHQDAVDEGMATVAEADLLLAWRRYRVLLNRINTEDQPVTWPEMPSIQL
ncbi:TPA: tail fiber assembly protein [Enterobacter hormaechei subsp. xiangfangensis]|nr:tail fiber assembly protein [Enterobacter hormaechei subsp. xiangfangensis]HAV1890619.1 tail fiber assembly protein [Enterobacter hormaechei subsp. xiangfangensis]